jgi:hypothetical protein
MYHFSMNSDIYMWSNLFKSIHLCQAENVGKCRNDLVEVRALPTVDLIPYVRKKSIHRIVKLALVATSNAVVVKATRDER